MQSMGQIRDVESLVEAALHANQRFPGQVWWRGQRDAAWDLSPSVSRLPHNARSEQSLIARFRHKAPSRHPQVPQVADQPGLFLMQHYRLPRARLTVYSSHATSAPKRPRRVIIPTVSDTDGALFASHPTGQWSQIGRSVLLLPDDPEFCFNQQAFDRKSPELDRS
jgi:hypothetical protein